MWVESYVVKAFVGSETKEFELGFVCVWKEFARGNEC